MAGKRKFSESFNTDTDVVYNLMKYRATSSNGCPEAIRTSCPAVSQDELKTMLVNFVTVYEGLDSENNSTKKPNFSYTELIFLSIMRSPNFCLPISEIYRYIETRFIFFKHTKKEHWKNAIRHSLSKTRCFTKIGLDNQKPRNGILNRSAFLWTIMPKSLLNFARGDYRPSNKLSGTNALRSGFQQLNSGGLWDGCVVTLASRTEAFRNILNNSTCPARIFQLQVCNITYTNCVDVDVFGVDLPFVSSNCNQRVSQALMSPENTSAASPFDMSCRSPITTHLTPSSEMANDSFYSRSPSDSGYDTMGDQSSPEHGSSGEYPEMSPFRSPPAIENIHQTDSAIPGVDPTIIFNIPTIPELPPLEELSTEADRKIISLPCIIEDNETAANFDAACCFPTRPSFDFLQDLTMSMEDRSILQEFLLF